MQKPTLDQVLSFKQTEEIDDSLLDHLNNEQVLEEKEKPEGFCCECEDQPAAVFCLQCSDDFCEVCFQFLHRKGTRQKHTLKHLDLKGGAQQPTKKEIVSTKEAEEEETENLEASHFIPTKSLEEYKSFESFIEKSKYVPLRLSLVERKSLRLLDAALTVSDYTDKIDILHHSNKPNRMIKQIKDLCAILCGLVVAADYEVGQELIQDKDYKFNEDFFQKIFEIGRRHKIMNPEKMRDNYGKLIYLLMDSQLPQVENLLEFSCIQPLKTVYKVLEEAQCLQMLEKEEEILRIATGEIFSEGKARREVQKEIQRKEQAINILARKYQNSFISEEQLKTCIYSIGDHHSFLRGNRDPIDKMIQYLKTFFAPHNSNPSLSISSGRQGARLSHSHERQYYYVLQSMTLWREINHHMFKLWCLAEQDLLDTYTNPYRLRDTGQGLNRVQFAPRISKEIHRILAHVMNEVGERNWVGSSVVHLGDTNVPNALFFIDKYTQVSRILNPIVLCLEKIDSDLVKNPTILHYIKETFTGVNELKVEILADFFRHGFDGSGADNFFDAGSCIDGRLTSAWNWCNEIEKKRYFPIFLLTGFIGFN